VDIPDEALISLKTDSESFARELVLLAAVKVFELGKLSSGRAAELAGLSRVEFLLELRRYRVSPFPVTPAELHKDVLNV
jgi:predicted HTH domain antitoxin